MAHRQSKTTIANQRKYPGCNYHSCVEFLEVEERKTDIVLDGEFVLRNM